MKSKYETIDEIIEKVSPDELIEYIQMNYEDYSREIIKIIQTKDK